MAKGRADLGFHWNVFLLIVTVPTIYWGGRIAQATGVAAALLFLQIALLVPIYVYLVQPLIGKCALEYANGILKPILAALLMAFGLVLVRAWNTGFPPYAELAMLVALGSMLYLLLLHVFDRNAVYEFRSILFHTGS